MDDERKERECYQTYQPSWAEVTLPQLRQLARRVCLIASSQGPHSEGLAITLEHSINNTIAYGSAFLETPLLLPAAFFGTIAACFTGVLALIPITIKTVGVFRTAAASIVMAFIMQLCQDVLEICSGLLKNTVARPMVRLVPSALAYLSANFTRSSDKAQRQKPSTPARTYPTQVVTGNISPSPLQAPSLDLEDELVATNFESLRNWEIPNNLHDLQAAIARSNDSSRTASRHRRHRRTSTGSSLRLSGAASPELVRTPLRMGSETRNENYRRRNRSGSGSSSPESVFQLTSRIDTNAAAAANHRRRHSRSGSSSTTATQ